MDLKTTTQVAQMMGTARSKLIVLLGRHPDLKPVQQLPAGDFLWTEAEIERVIAHRSTHKRGRPKKQSAGVN